MRSLLTRWREVPSGTRLSVWVVLVVLAFTVPFVVNLWPDSSDHGTMPNGTQVVYHSAEVTSADLSGCEEWIAVDTLCGEADVVTADGEELTVGVPREGAIAGLKAGDKAIVGESTTAEGSSTIHFYYTLERGMPLTVFAVLALIGVGVLVRGRGIRAFVSLAASAVFIWLFLIEGIYEGGHPLLYAATTSILVLTAVLHFTHGFSAKTLAAWAGTITGVLTALGVGWIASSAAHITGMGDSTLAPVFAEGHINTSVLALAALLIALIGVLNDIAIAQSATMFSIRADGARGRQALIRAFHVGRDHAASAIYTVAFSVLGTGLAGLIVSRSAQMPGWALLQEDNLAYTLIQVLSGIVGLVIAMTATTLFAFRLSRVDEGDSRVLHANLGGHAH